MKPTRRPCNQIPAKEGDIIYVDDVCTGIKRLLPNNYMVLALNVPYMSEYEWGERIYMRLLDLSTSDIFMTEMTKLRYFSVEV